MKAWGLITLTSLLLTGCAVTPEEAAQLNATLDGINADAQHATQGFQNQTAQTYTPSVGPYGQQSTTSTYYCRDATDRVVTCNQIK
jgi:hypothetical protein